MKLATLAGIAVLAFVLPVSAGATVKKEGAWPDTEKKVDLDLDGSPSEGLKQLAKAAGWSLVVQNGASIDRAGSDVHVAVADQPADAVLDALFVGRNVVAHRSGQLVTVTLDAPPAVAASTPAPFPTARGEDREVVGSDVVVQSGEIVHTVTVTGGSAVVKGTVTGDLVVTGGSAKVRNGAHVVGNATVLGGSLRIDNGARIDGAVHVTGGKLDRADGAIIGGEMSSTGKGHHTHHQASDSDSDASPSRVSGALRSMGKALTRSALLFVLGCVLLALLTPRMERLRLEIASRPMRSFALGLVGGIVGAIALGIALLALCVTIIGIPVAVLAVVVLFVALYGSVASVLTTFGAAAVGHKTDNPYLHLLVGCSALLVVTCIPWLGGLVLFAVMTLAVGALVATRGAGFLEKKRPSLMA